MQSTQPDLLKKPLNEPLLNGFFVQFSFLSAEILPLDGQRPIRPRLAVGLG